ncbi:aminotransferase class I/II-fold pyridoxal phosphate-dependent enzyme, partial [Escherichia coli]
YLSSRRNSKAAYRFLGKILNNVKKWQIPRFINTDKAPAYGRALALLKREGHYHRHVRRMRQIYQRNIEIYTCWLREFFPCGICVTRPKGGFMLWVELPEQVDMVCVAKQLCRLKIQVAPGSLFSAAGKYRNCVRINCALPPTEKHKAVMVKLGEAVKVAME